MSQRLIKQYVSRLLRASMQWWLESGGFESQLFALYLSGTLGNVTSHSVPENPLPLVKGVENNACPGEGMM